MMFLLEVYQPYIAHKYSFHLVRCLSLSFLRLCPSPTRLFVDPSNSRRVFNKQESVNIIYPRKQWKINIGQGRRLVDVLNVCH